jgi:hypothetical protein
MSEEEFVPAQIVINIGEHDITYETDLSIPEVVLWLRFVEHMIMQQMKEPPPEA